MRTRHRSTFVRPSVAALAVMTAAVLVQCTAAPPPPAAGPPLPPAASPPASAPPAPADPPTIDPVTAAELGASWRPGCPVGPEQLRRVGVDHIGFDGQTHRGQLIVHEDLVSQAITIFEQLYRLGFPIEKICTVDQFPAASDELQMEDNNTSAFSYRDIPGTGRWSQHAYGRAIDVNPLLNPYATGAFQPKHVSLVPWLRSTAGNRARLNRVSPPIQIGQRPRGRVDTDVWPAAPS